MLDKANDKTIWIIYDPVQQHFGSTKTPKTYMNHTNRSIKFCLKCCTCFNPTNHERHAKCLCEEPEVQAVKKRKTPLCPICNRPKSQCTTCERKCNMCKTFFKKGYNRSEGEGHRCILYDDDTTPKTFWRIGDLPDGQKTQLWAYDVESCIAPVETTRMGYDFQVDENNQFLEYQTTHVLPSKHSVCLIVAQNVFDDSQVKIFKGEMALKEFIQFALLNNGGKSIFVAHNGSGYDTCLIYDMAKRLDHQNKMVPLMRGSKFMELKIGNVMFRDSMLMSPGSLAGLAKDYFGEESGIRKGHFPHLFNTVENQNYKGPIPAKEYYDMRFIAKDKKAIDDFNSWYAEQSGEWDLQHEMLEYCKNDVKVLAAIMLEFHNICVSKYQHSPWFEITSPGYVHKTITKAISQTLELPEDKQERKEYVDDLAYYKHWAVLKPEEYWFAKMALRGGRTDVRKVYHKVSDEDWARGVRIRYQDVVSLYPFVQISNDYPVGLPVIYIYDKNFTPCWKHRNPDMGNDKPLECNCPLESRHFQDRLLDIRHEEFHPSLFSQLDFFGLICVSATPPSDLFHPVLLSYDHETKKCNATLQPIIKHVFTTPELLVAIANGYRIDRVHRFDKYNKAPGLWNDMVKEFYLEKMVYSKNTPNQETQDYLVREYEERFDMGDMVRESFPRWQKNGARKTVAKVMVNCGWGKHCQRPNLPRVQVIEAGDSEGYFDFYNDLQRRNQFLKGYTPLENGDTFIKTEMNSSKRLDFHDTYLPAGLFVPAYGRLTLYQQLRKLDKRVLYHDTDSIIYIYDPLLENIPAGKILGDWELEDVGQEDGLDNPGIREFVGLAPKSYCLMRNNGVPTKPKIKGISLKHAHESQINFQTMKDQVMEYFGTGHSPVLQVPQFNFNFDMRKGMSTYGQFKKLQFQPETLKGDLKDDYYVYPFGYNV